MFYASLLRRYKENQVYGENYEQPPTQLDNEGQETYTIETILRHQKRGKGYQYHMKWEGYLITEASWVPEETFLINTSNIITYERLDLKHRFNTIACRSVRRTGLVFPKYI